VLVSQLRKKVELNSRHPKFICTDPWFGYRFEPPPTELPTAIAQESR
jgi:hypothetical protein